VCVCVCVCVCLYFALLLSVVGVVVVGFLVSSQWLLLALPSAAALFCCRVVSVVAETLTVSGRPGVYTRFSKSPFALVSLL
jgi:hypothetical protein